MNGNKIMNRNRILAIIVALMLSLILNVGMISQILKYRYKIGTEAYNYIESVRSINENNIVLLKKAMDTGSIDNMGLLKLYKNYSDLNDDMASLWNEYIYYEENRRFLISKKNIDTSNVTVGDVNSKIEDFFNDILEMEMQTQNYKITLEGNIMEKFQVIYSLENEKSNYYNEFCINELKGSIQNEKKDKIIKKHYWMDILQGYNDISKEYIDYEFKIS